MEKKKMYYITSKKKQLYAPHICYKKFNLLLWDKLKRVFMEGLEIGDFYNFFLVGENDG